MNNRVKMYEKGDTIVVSNNALGVPNNCLGRSAKVQSISHNMNGNVVYDADCVYNEKGHWTRIFLFNSDIKCKL